MQVGLLLAENEVTRLERPDLVESAVAVEFSSRMQTVWQVRVLAGDAGSAATCGTPDASVPGRAARTASCTGEPSIGTSTSAPHRRCCDRRGDKRRRRGGRILVHQDGCSGRGPICAVAVCAVTFASFMRAPAATSSLKHSAKLAGAGR